MGKQTRMLWVDEQQSGRMSTNILDSQTKSSDLGFPIGGDEFKPWSGSKNCRTPCRREMLFILILSFFFLKIF